MRAIMTATHRSGLAGVLRPPAHRGPLIASGGVVLAVGILLWQLRDDPDDVVALNVAANLTPAALFLWLGLQQPGDGGRPRAHESVLLVTGLVLLVPGLLWLADLLGTNLDEVAASTITWIALVEGAVATACAIRRGSAICAYIAAVALAVAFLAAVEWVAEPSESAYRWLLLIVALMLVFVSLLLRGSRPRHSEQMVNAAGLAILGIAAVPVVQGVFALFGGSPELPGFWEVVVLGAGLGLIAYAAADRAPGAAYIGAANIGAFLVVTTDGDTLRWWPLALLVIGALMLLAGLRPARPLPPEPQPYRAGEVPLTVRVRDP